MSCELDSSLEGWDRTLLDLSSKMAEPFCKAWELVRFRLVAPLDSGKFTSASTQTNEIATRILIGLGIVFFAFLCVVLPTPMLYSVTFLGVGSKVLRIVGFALQKRGYTHVRGLAPEKIVQLPNGQIKLMSWNVCGVGGGMSLDHGGVLHWRERLDPLVDKIKKEDPDVLVLQEIYDTALAEALIEKLKAEYAHFFIHLGPNVWGGVGGCMVLSKCAVHRFSYTSFMNNKWTLNRGFATLEIKGKPQDSIPCARIIGTHLVHGQEPEDEEKRMVQIAQIVDSIVKKNLAIPTILAGDLNMQRDGEEGALLSRYLVHGYRGSDPTCTERLVAQWDLKERKIWDEKIDYISFFKRILSDGTRLPVIDANITLESGHLVPAFDLTYNTQTALSDHHGVAVTVRGLPVPRIQD